MSLSATFSDDLSQCILFGTSAVANHSKGPSPPPSFSQWRTDQRTRRCLEQAIDQYAQERYSTTAPWFPAKEMGTLLVRLREWKKTVLFDIYNGSTGKCIDSHTNNSFSVRGCLATYHELPWNPPPLRSLHSSVRPYLVVVCFLLVVMLIGCFLKLALLFVHEDGEDETVGTRDNNASAPSPHVSSTVLHGVLAVALVAVLAFGLAAAEEVREHRKSQGEIACLLSHSFLLPPYPRTFPPLETFSLVRVDPYVPIHAMISSQVTQGVDFIYFEGIGTPLVPNANSVSLADTYGIAYYCVRVDKEKRESTSVPLGTQQQIITSWWPALSSVKGNYYRMVSTVPTAAEGAEYGGWCFYWNQALCTIHILLWNHQLWIPVLVIRRTGTTGLNDPLPCFVSPTSITNRASKDSRNPPANGIVLFTGKYPSELALVTTRGEYRWNPTFQGAVRPRTWPFVFLENDMSFVDPFGSASFLSCLLTRPKE